MIIQGLKKTGRVVCVLSALISTGAPAFAAVDDVTPSLFSRAARPPEIANVQVLSNMVRSGAKLFYIGERSGLHGWFVSKDGQIQVIYVTSDGKTAVVGGMFTSEGDNVSGAQIQALAEANKEVAAMMGAASTQQNEVTRVGAVAGGAASVPGDPNASRKNAVGGLPGVALSPGERLIQDLEAAAGVTLGKNDQAEVMMVMDVNCAYCRETWKAMRDYVMNDRLQLRMIPITLDVKSDNTRAAAKLLEAQNPLEVWDKYVGGDKSVLAGNPDEVRLRAVLANRELADRWNIKATPYLVYRGRDGRVKIVQGEPKRMAAILADLVR